MRTLGDVDDYNQAVGGLFDVVDLHDEASIFVIDEDAGLILGLPFNSWATNLWWLYCEMAQHRTILVGDAVIVGLPDAEGWETSVPGSLLEALTHQDTFRVDIRLGYDPKWLSNHDRFDSYWKALEWALQLRWRADIVGAVQIIADNTPGTDVTTL